MFNSLTYGKIEYGDVIAKIIETANSEGCSLIIGGDSYVIGGEICYVQVIIVHKQYGGAFFFYRKQHEKGKMHMKSRLINETMKTVMLADEVRTSLSQLFPSGLIKEVHVDLGYGGASKEVISQVIGMVKAYSFVPIIKPDAYAASAVADRFSKR